MSKTDPEKVEIVIMGAGGMGALFGAILKQGGLSVTLVDTNLAHIERINECGLSIAGYGGDRVVDITAISDAAVLEKADIILFQCKAHSTLAAAHAVRHLVEGGAVCISFQNGLGNEELIAEVLGKQSVLGGLTAMAGYMTGAGEIRDFDRVPSYIGEMSGGVTARVERIAESFTVAGLETYPSADIRHDIWKKLLGNIAMSAVSGITNLTSVQCLSIPELKKTSLRALDEALAVAGCCGIELERADAVHGLELITQAGGTGDNKSSLCVDLLNNRPTEVEFIYGSVIRLAAQHQLPVPTLETLAALVAGLESH